MLLNHYSAWEAGARVIGELHDTCLNDHPKLGSVNTTQHARSGAPLDYQAPAPTLAG
jgi:hypothetical protein